MTIGTNNIPGSAAHLGGAVTNDLRDIKPPIEIPSGWAWVWWLVAVVGVAALVFMAWRYWQRKKSFVPPVPMIPPHVRACQKLEEALAFLSQPREFCIMVSDALRWYLEERFDFHAPERTTEEFLHELQGTALLSAAQKESLADFLQQCDLVKFARYEPREPELRALHASALRLVDETSKDVGRVSNPSKGGLERGVSGSDWLQTHPTSNDGLQTRPTLETRPTEGQGAATPGGTSDANVVP